MAGGQRTLTIKFVGDSKNAVRSVKDLVSSMDESEPAGKRVAAAMKLLSADAEAAFGDARDAAEKLARALGDDAVAQINAAGRSVDGYVADLQRMGLSFDDVRGDVDELADAIRQVEGTKVNIDSLDRPLKDTSANLATVRDNADQSGSVLANMVGNSVQDLGALGGVAGTAGMALGQLAEYATEGNINLSGLAKVAAPMAAVTVVAWGVSKAVGAIRDNAERAKEETELWLDVQSAIADGKARDAAIDLLEQYEGTIDALEDLGHASTDWLDAMRGQRDLVGELSTRYETLGSKAANSVDGLRELSEAELEEYEALSKLIPNLREQTENRDNAVRSYDENIDRVNVLTRELIGQGPVNKELVNQYGRIVDRVDDVGTAMGDVVDEAIDPMQQALDDLGVAYDKLSDKFDDNAAADRANEALANLMVTMADQESSWTDLRQASDAYGQSLADLVMETEEIPTEVKSEFIAMLDRGQYDLVAGQLDALERTRTAEFQLLVTTVASAELKQMELRFNRDINGNGAIGRAAGGTVLPGNVYAVGDNPDGSWNPTTELLVPSQGGRILSAAESRAAVAAGLGGGGGVTYVTQHFSVPPNADLAALGRVTREALLADAGANGPVFATVR